MYCLNCKTEVKEENGYCSRCGTPASMRMCAKGHILDPSWGACPYCTPGAAPPGISGGAVPGSKGRTVAEGQASGGFVKGATLLDTLDQNPPGGRGGSKKATVIDTGEAPAKKRTVFDSGTASAPEQRPSLPRLAGWLVTFSNNPSGDDYRIREGRNIIGTDANDCDVVVGNDGSISTKHAVIMYRDGTFQLRDNDSTNGTYVNGKDIFGQGAVPVRNLDRIRLGKSEFVFYTLRQD